MAVSGTSATLGEQGRVWQDLGVSHEDVGGNLKIERSRSYRRVRGGNNCVIQSDRGASITLIIMSMKIVAECLRRGSTFADARCLVVV